MPSSPMAGTRFEDGIDRYGDRLRDTHDLHHILTGYGHDRLGKQMFDLQAFTLHNSAIWTYKLIAYMGGFELKRRVARSSPIMTAVHEGYRIGKAAKNLVHEDINAFAARTIGRCAAASGHPRTGRLQSGT